jgi:excisionase family DNA binding protein
MSLSDSVGPRLPRTARGWTLAEATQQTGLTYWQLRHAVRRGHIAAERVGAGALVLLDRDDVIAFARVRLQAGG